MLLRQVYDRFGQKRIQTAARSIIALILYTATNLFLGIYFRGSEPGLYPDASAHYASGMMVLDYFSSNFGSNIFDHIAEFHEHYPFVAVGLWPPLFHLFEAMWMGVFSNKYFSLLALDAFVAGFAGYVTMTFASRLIPISAAVVTGILLPLFPMFLTSSDVLRIDLFTGIFIFLASMSFVDFLDQPIIKRALLVILMSVAALMSKGTAMALVFIFPLTVLLRRDFWVLQNKLLWLIAGATGLIAGPWYILTSTSSSQGFRYEVGIEYSASAVQYFFAKIYQNIGLFGVVLAIVACAFLWRSADRKVRAYASGMIACVTGALIFQIIIPVALQDRYIAAIYMPLAILVGMGAIGLFPNNLKMCVSLIAVYAAITGYQSSSLFPNNAQAPVQYWLSHTDITKPKAILLLASPEVEGLIATDILMNLPSKYRENITILRGVKLLGGGGYNNHDYEPKYQESSDALEAIRKTGISLIFYEQSARSSIWLHNEQFARSKAENPKIFDKLQTFDLGNGRLVNLVTLRSNLEQSPDWQSIWRANSNKEYDYFSNRFGNR